MDKPIPYFCNHQPPSECDHCQMWRKFYEYEIMPNTCPTCNQKRRPKVGEWILVQVASNNDGDMDIGINSGFPNSFTFVRRGYYKLQGVGK